MHADPVAPQALPGLLAAVIDGHGPALVIVAIDGAPPTRPEQVAAAVVAELRLLGRPAVTVNADDFLRPASVRLERGRYDHLAYRSDWLDAAALSREVLDPFAATGRYLPSLRDPARDRATRAQPEDTSPGAVLLVAGPLLLDKGLAFDLTVHLSLSAAALTRQSDASLAWSLPAYDGYPGGLRPDVVVRLDDPRHPAVIRRS
ncbi:MAG: uridine kinase [Mycobacteriales bacterium]